MVINIEKKSAKSNQLDVLLSLRGVACLAVVLHHCNPPRNSLVYHGHDLSWLILSPGGIAVWIFFCLSGYLMGKAFYTKRYVTNLSGVINFWQNRLLRIVPLYYFAVVILAIFVYTDILKVENWGYLLRIMTFTYNHALPPAWNGAFWSLSTEIQFYLIIPFIYSYFSQYLITRKRTIFVAFLIIISIFLLKCFLWLAFHRQIAESQNFGIKYWYTPLITNMDLFMCGFLVNSLIDSLHNPNSAGQTNWGMHRISPSIIKSISVVLMIGLYFFAGYHLYSQELYGLPERAGKGVRTSMAFFGFQPLTALIASFFIFAFEFHQATSPKFNQEISFDAILKNPLRSLEIIGNLSYGIYIWHLPIITKITPIILSENPLEAFYIRSIHVVILSTILATITYYLVEAPFVRLKILAKV
jgi:peptidoglycan/LPS O-acetylase OafA/YrhL